jgi:hypothetical protein
LIYQINAYLYLSSDNGLPMDIRLATFVELSEPFSEFDGIERQKKLKEKLAYVIETYGTNIFDKEIAANVFDFPTRDGKVSILQKLKNSRVNIMHYSLKPEPDFLNESNSLLSSVAFTTYCLKMKLLCRLFILKNSGISIDETKLSECIQKIESIAYIDFSKYPDSKTLNDYLTSLK